MQHEICAIGKDVEEKNYDETWIYVFFVYHTYVFNLGHIPSNNTCNLKPYEYFVLVLQIQQINLILICITLLMSVAIHLTSGLAVTAITSKMVVSDILSYF